MSAGIWVTGLGLLTPLGADVESTWSRLVRGDRALAPVRVFDGGGQRADVVAEVPFVGTPRSGGPEWSRTSAMAVAAAGEAMRMARLDPRRSRVGLVVGGTTGGMFETERLLAQLHSDPEHEDPIARMLSHPLSATAQRVQEQLGPFVRVRTLSSACSSSANAVVLAATWLLLGEVDAVVAGGSDGLCRLTLAGFNALCAIDPDGCRPFHRNRRGTTLGEGAGFLVLERRASARSRSVEPIAELAGWASGSEAHHITQPAPGGDAIASLTTRALARAGLSPADIDYVHAHGTGTPANDLVEVVALSRALGGEMARVPVSSSKGQIGHGLGAAGAIEAAITALVVARGTLVPTAALDDPDPALDVVHVACVGRDVARVRAALCNAFGFGGMDTVLAFAEVNDRRRSPSNGPRPDAGPPAAVRQGVVVTGVALVVPSGPVGSADIATLPNNHSPRVAPANLDAFLDAHRARRFDTTARLATVAVDHLLRESRVPREGTGVVFGSPFASVDGSAAFMHRVFSKGPRAASPAEFPNLVPSAAVANVSIYMDLRGPTFSVADLSISAESAFASAVDLVAAGEAPRMVAGASEPCSGIGERVRSLFFSRASGTPADRVERPRRDLAVAVLVESAGHAAAREGTILAQVEQVVEWRTNGVGAIRSIGIRGAGAREVIVARASPEVGALLLDTPWHGCPRIACAGLLGESDGLGGVAIAVAAARIGYNAIDEALVIGLAGTSGVAVRLSRAHGA